MEVPIPDVPGSTRISKLSSPVHASRPVRRSSRRSARSARRPAICWRSPTGSRGHGWPHVAMESTGVYRKPIWHVLEGAFELIWANALQIRSVPGRKSDVNDATWIADLLAYGSIRSSLYRRPPFMTCAI